MDSPHAATAVYRITEEPYYAPRGDEIAVTGKGDFAVTAEDSQICVDGLRHGERYGIILRQGIPSSIPGENLQKNADYYGFGWTGLDVKKARNLAVTRFSGLLWTA